jgi:hypothetical protein
MMSTAVQKRWHKDDDDDEHGGAIKIWWRTPTMQEQESPTLMEHHFRMYPRQEHVTGNCEL